MNAVNQPGTPGIATHTAACTTVGDGGMRDAALAYAALGIAVFPLHHPLLDGGCSCGAKDCVTSAGKHPRTYNGLKAATTDCDQIRGWWNAWPDANIGLPTGAVNEL